MTENKYFILLKYYKFHTAPKIHKDNVPRCPLVSSIGLPVQQLAYYKKKIYFFFDLLKDMFLDKDDKAPALTKEKHQLFYPIKTNHFLNDIFYYIG